MPKTVRNQFGQALNYRNLMRCHHKCQRGKRGRPNVVQFNLKQEEYVHSLYEQLQTK